MIPVLTIISIEAARKVR